MVEITLRGKEHAKNTATGNDLSEALDNLSRIMDERKRPGTLRLTPPNREPGSSIATATLTAGGGSTSSGHTSIIIGTVIIDFDA